LADFVDTSLDAALAGADDAGAAEAGALALFHSVAREVPAYAAFLAESGVDPNSLNSFTISYFGANVYPENVSVGLEQAPVDQWVTGKFVMQSREDDDRNRLLSIVVELGPGVAPGQDKIEAITDSILRHLLRLNSEFAHYVPQERQRPQVELAPQGCPAYFPVGVKHRYTRR
jgi:phenylacetate-coenzyme A ligase PaaK-like adenylate-forming protein